MNFELITNFEKEIAKFFGSPFAIAVDSCTHGIELALRYTGEKEILVPKRTYLSIPFLAEKLCIEREWRDEEWEYYYTVSYGEKRIIDAAVLWKKDSYIPNTFMCISFQYQKQGQANELIVGGALSYYLGSDNGIEVYAGLWSRVKECMIPYVGLEWNHIRAGFTYDVGGTNTIASSRFYQSSEISLIYILDNKSKAFKLKCPKF